MIKYKTHDDRPGWGASERPQKRKDGNEKIAPVPALNLLLYYYYSRLDGHLKTSTLCFDCRRMRNVQRPPTRYAVTATTTEVPQHVA